MLNIDATSYRSTRGFGKRERFLIMHYTAANFAASVNALTKGSASAHYLIPACDDPTYQQAGFRESRIFRLVDEKDRAWHAGVSHWAGRDNLNDTSIGIEIVNLATSNAGQFTFPDYESNQIEAVIALALDIIARYPDMSPKNIVGHSDIAYGRKSDPGPRFPWRTLFESGVGAWFDGATKSEYELAFASGLPAQDEIVGAFRRYGYAAATTAQQLRNLVRAFQMHFRPARTDGVLDAETCAILYALNKKYP